MQCDGTFNATHCTKHHDGRLKRFCDPCWALGHPAATDAPPTASADPEAAAQDHPDCDQRGPKRVKWNDPVVTASVGLPPLENEHTLTLDSAFPSTPMTRDTFTPAATFDCSIPSERRPGHTFKLGDQGLGFYPNVNHKVADSEVDSSEVDPPWPTLSSDEWGSEDFPGHQPSAKDAKRAMFHRHNQIPAPEEQTKGDPLLMYNSSVRSDSLAASLPPPAPASHTPVSADRPWEILRGGRLYIASCGSFFRHKLGNAADLRCEQPTLDNVEGGPTTSIDETGTTRRVAGPSLPYKEYPASALWKMLVSYCAKYVDGLQTDIELDTAGKAGSRRRFPSVFKIPARLIRGNGLIRWDLREYWIALRALRTEFPNRPLNDLSVSPGVKISVFDESQEIKPRFRKERLLARCRKHGITDEYLLSQLTSVGMLNHSEVAGDLVIAPNYRSVAEHAIKAQALKQKEEVDGLVSQGYLGIPLLPGRKQAYGAVIQPPKLDPRFCADLRSPRGDDDEGGCNSVNAMIDLGDRDKFIHMVLTGPLAFAQDVGKLMSDIDTNQHPVWLCAADWRRFFRQLLKPLSELWTQIVAVDPDGFRLDFAMIFGDAAAPAGANNVEDLFLELIYHEFVELVNDARRDGAWTASDEEHFAAVEAWSSRRCERLQVSHADLWANPTWRARQQRLGVLHGFFDDSLVGAHGGKTHTAPKADSEAADDLRERANPPKPRVGARWPSSGVFAMMVRAIVHFADDIELEISAEKMLCGTSDGLTGTLDLDSWNVDRQHGVPPHRRRVWWINMVDGHMPVLGKLMNLERKHVHDSPQRIDALSESVEETIAFANSKEGTAKFKRPSAPIRTIQRQNGIGFFICQTEPWIRAYLNPQTHALKLLNALYPAALAANRANKKKTGTGVIPWFTWMFYGDAAQQAMRKFVNEARKLRGTPFNALRPTPGADSRPVTWIMEDASGKETGGGGALYWQANLPARMAMSFRPWALNANVSEVGDDVHSTTQETATAVRNLELAVAHLGDGPLDLVECIDSQSTCAILGQHRYHAAILKYWVERRADLLRTHPNVRVWTLWNCREHGRLPDGVSNGHTPYEHQGPAIQNMDATIDTWTGIEWAHAALKARGYPSIDWWPKHSDPDHEWWTPTA